MNTPRLSAPELCDAVRTAHLLDFSLLMEAVAQAAVEVDTGTLLSPARMVVPLVNGGTMLSMPATAPDIAVHKLVNVQRANAPLGLPTIHGIVTAFDAATGRPLCLLDGPEVTGRRTAAVTLLAIRTLLGRSPQHVLLIGAGAQSRWHQSALQAVFPQARMQVRGRDAVGTPVPDDVDAVVTLTTSTEPVYDETPRAGRVVVGVGAFKPEMAEIGARSLAGSDLYADDPLGARHEAGDLLRAGVDWSRVKSLGALLREPPDLRRPAVFKSVGTAAWDLAAARTALHALRAERSSHNT